MSRRPRVDAAAVVLLLLAVHHAVSAQQLCTEECFHTTVNTIQSCVHVATSCGIDEVVLPQPKFPTLMPSESQWTGLAMNDSGVCCLQCLSRTSSRVIDDLCFQINSGGEPICDGIQPPATFCEASTGGFIVRTFHPGDACTSNGRCPVRFTAGACCQECVNEITGEVDRTLRRCTNQIEADCNPLQPCVLLPGDGWRQSVTFTAGTPCRNSNTCPRARGQRTACCLQCDAAPELSDCVSVFSEFECANAVLFGCAANATTRTFLEGSMCRGSRCPPLACNAFPQDVSLPEQCELGSPSTTTANDLSVRCGENASFSLCFAEGVLVGGGLSAVVSDGDKSEACALSGYLGCAAAEESTIMLAVNGGAGETPTPNMTTTGNGNGNGGAHEGISIATLIVVCLGTCILIVMLIGCIVAWQRVGPRFSRARRSAQDFS